MSAHTDDRSSGSSLPGGQAGGPVLSGIRPDEPSALGPQADPEAVARKILLDQLTGQARSRAELAKKLSGKGVPDEIAQPLLTRFEDVGLIDDPAFARAWVQSRHVGKGLARRALEQELRVKGVGDDAVRDALDELDPEDEIESARMLVRRRMRSVQRLDRTTAIRRLTAILARKGYPSGVALRIVREELEAAGQAAEVTRSPP